MKIYATSLMADVGVGDFLFSPEQNEYFTLFKENGFFLLSLNEGTIAAATEDSDNLQKELKILIAKGLLVHYPRSEFKLVLEAV